MLIAKTYICKGNFVIDSVTLIAFIINPHWLSVIFYIRIF